MRRRGNCSVVSRIRFEYSEVDGDENPDKIKIVSREDIIGDASHDEYDVTTIRDGYGVGARFAAMRAPVLSYDNVYGKV